MISNLFCINCYAVSHSDLPLLPPLYTKMPAHASLCRYYPEIDFPTFSIVYISNRYNIQAQIPLDD